MTFFIFYIDHKMYWFLTKTLQTSLDCEYVNTKKYYLFFNILKNVFWIEGAYAHESQIEFPERYFRL
jgi:hypothetical protein